MTEFDAPTRLVQVGDDVRTTVTLAFGVEPQDAGTRVSISVDLRPRRWLAPMFAVVWALFLGRRAQAAIDETAVNAERLLESSRA